jgi:hypothetical protein
MLRIYHEMLGVPMVDGRNPCPLPVSVSRKDLVSNLYTRQYLITSKADGERRTLLMCTIDGESHSCFVNRKLETTPIPIAAAKSFFKGTIFDGELVKTCDGHVFLVFDIYAYKGSSDCQRKSLCERAEILSTCINSSETDDIREKSNKGFIVSLRPTLKIVPKPFFQFSHADILRRQRPDYRIDGYILQPCHSSVTFGRSNDVMKVKFKHTVDLLIDSAGVAKLSDRNTMVALSDVLPDLAVDASPSDCIAEFLIDSNKLIFVRKRNDKSHPNSLETVSNTIKDSHDGMDETEFFEIIASCASRDTAP